MKNILLSNLTHAYSSNVTPQMIIQQNNAWTNAKKFFGDAQAQAGRPWSMRLQIKYLRKIYKYKYRHLQGH